MKKKKIKSKNGKNIFWVRQDNHGEHWVLGITPDPNPNKFTPLIG